MTRQYFGRTGLLMAIAVTTLIMFGACSGSPYKTAAAGPIVPTSGAASGGYNLMLKSSGITAKSYAMLDGKQLLQSQSKTSGLMQVTLAKNAAMKVGTHTVTLMSPASGSAKAKTLMTTNFVVVADASASAQPTFTSFSPAQGSDNGGAVVSITGTNFDSLTGVEFGSVAATSVTFVSATQLTAVAPALAAGQYEITVTASNGLSAVGPDTYQSIVETAPAPTISSFSPTTGGLAGGTEVTINGTNLSATSSIAIGGVVCPFTYLTTSNGTSGTCATGPEATAGSYNVVVTNTDGQQGTAPTQFTYSVGPVISSLNPNSGVAGTVVTIVGSDFLPNLQLLVNGVAAQYTPGTTTQLTVTMPAGSGAETVEIVNTDGTSVSFNSFVYTTPTVVTPTLSSVSSNVNPPLSSGGEILTLNGSNFAAGMVVDIDGTSTVCAGVVINSANSAACTMPALAAGNHSIFVSLNGQVSGAVVLGIADPPAPTCVVTVDGGANNVVIHADDETATVNYQCNYPAAFAVQRFQVVNGTVSSPAVFLGQQIMIQGPTSGAYTFPANDLNYKWFNIVASNGVPGSTPYSYSGAVLRYIRVVGGQARPDWGTYSLASFKACMYDVGYAIGEKPNAACGKDVKGEMSFLLANSNSGGDTPFDNGYFADLVGQPCRCDKMQANWPGKNILTHW